MPTTTQPRAIGYVRVSRAREEMISPDVQRASIEEHCRRRGYQLVDVVEDLDSTGRTFARKGVHRCIEAVERGDADVVVVWKWSRFGRTRRDWYVNLDRIDVVGGRLESSTEDADTATSVGKFTRGMLVELAAFESDRIGDVWKDVHADRRAKGLTAQGGDRYGYIRTGKTFIPDPVTAPVLVRMYEMAAAGTGRSKIAAALNADGIPGPRGGSWYGDRVARILDSGFGAGRISQGIRNETTWSRGAHEAVISEDVWEAYRAHREAHRADKSTSKHRYTLSGLMKCGACGSPMSSDRLGRHAGYGFACAAWRAGKDDTCVTVSQKRAEDVALAWLAQYAEDIEEAAQRAPADPPAPTRRASSAKSDRRKAEKGLARLTAAWAAGDVTDKSYADARDILQGKIDAATRQEDVTRVRTSVPTVEPRGLLEEWDTLSVESRRQLLGTMIESVTVTPSGRRGVRPAVEVVPVEGLR